MDYSTGFLKMGRLPSARQVLLLVCAALSLFLLPATIHSAGRRQWEEPPSRPAFVEDTYQPNSEGVCTGRRWPEGTTPLYIITPTYPRGEQIPELTRTGQTLLHIDSLVWIVVEDAAVPTATVLDFLRESGHCYVYLKTRMPEKYQRLKTKPRGVANRNAGLQWIRDHAKNGGVLYFADDDNTYDRRIFEEIRETKKVSMFPVGLVTKLGVSSPIVRDGKVTGYYDGWISNRMFPVDMAGFAVNVNYFLSFPKAAMPFIAGREETKFLESLNITNSDIEPLADNCKKILVWHTRTFKNGKAKPSPKEFDISESNVETLRQQLWR